MRLGHRANFKQRGTLGRGWSNHSKAQALRLVAARARILIPHPRLGRVSRWAAPHELAIGAVVNPFAEDLNREIRLLEHKCAAGAEFVQSQMIFDLERLREFLERTKDLLADIRFYASVALLRNQRMADRARRLPGCLLPEATYRQISTGGGLELAREFAAELATIPGVDALHIYPLGAEVATREVAAAFRSARGVAAHRR